MSASTPLVVAQNATSANPGVVALTGDFGGTATAPVVAGVNGVAVTGSPSSGQVLTASSATAAAWQTPAGSSSAAKRITTDTYASTLTPNSATTDIYRITLTGSPTIANPSGTPTDGQQIIMQIIQDGTGSRTVTWGTGYRFSTDLPSPTLTTTAGALDILCFEYYGPSSKWNFVGLVRGF